MPAFKIIQINGTELYKSYLPVPNDYYAKPKRCALVNKDTGKLIGFFPINISLKRLKKII